MDRDTHLRRTRYRAWHRGTREADFLIGGFFDTCHSGWGAAELAWFDDLLEEQDVDIMAWCIGTAPVPERFAGAMMKRMQQLDYIKAGGADAPPSPLQGRGKPPQAARRGDDQLP